MLCSEAMTWENQILGAIVGGIAALLCIGISPPKSNREGLFRVGTGFLVVFASCGFMLDKMGYPPTVNNALMYALLVGSTAWWTLGAVVKVANQSPWTLIRWLATQIVGTKILVPKEESKPEDEEGK